MIVLDAGVLIAHLDPSDAHHETATKILLGGEPGRMLVHTLTLAVVLVGGVRVGRGAAMHDDLLAAGIEIAEHDDGEALRLAELRAGSRLKMPDCCVLDVAVRYGAALATFDPALATAAARYGVPGQPDVDTD